MTTMTDRRAVEVLAAHNEWRRGCDGPETDPTTLGLAIDHAIARLREPAEAQAQGGGEVRIEAHWLENVAAAASLLEASGDVFNVREAAALRKLISSAERTAPPSAPVEGSEVTAEQKIELVRQGWTAPNPPPSAPVGVEGHRLLTLALESAYDAGQAGAAFPFRSCERKVLQALAQQPAAVTQPAGGDVSNGSQQPAVVNEAMVERALAAYLSRQEDGESLYGCVTAALTEALAAQPGGEE